MFVVVINEKFDGRTNAVYGPFATPDDADEHLRCLWRDKGRELGLAYNVKYVTAP